MSEDEIAVVLDSEGKVKSGGHSIKEKDFLFMEDQLHGQFDALSGRLYQIVEAQGFQEKQERALKALIKREVWERFNDFIECMGMFTSEKYEVGHSYNGMPPDKEI